MLQHLLLLSQQYEVVSLKLNFLFFGLELKTLR